MASAHPHPLQTIGQAVGAAGAKLTGVQGPGKRVDDGPYFTNNEAIPFPDPAHSKTAGGLPLVSDTFLLQKQQHFNRSKMLERMVHPCGSGAFGHFEATKDVAGLTKANFLHSPGIKTPVFVRFSTVTLGREYPDLARNPRGFAIKFYTGEGNYDIVGLNFPVFFCRDPLQGPDNFLLDHNSLFDLLANSPEGNHAGMMFFSDHGTPNGWRNIHGYGCHTFKWVNTDGNFVYIKYHFLADHGQKQFTADEALRYGGEDADYSKRDLWQAIEKGEQISWTAYVQLGFDPFDVTKVWPKKQFPLQEFGNMVLNKNPENFHRDVEQAAFSPGSMVPGIEDSPDPLLQFRMFFPNITVSESIYIRSQVATFHFTHTPSDRIRLTESVNCPFMAASYSSLNFDGPLRVDANHGMNPQYAPNSFVHKFRPDTAETPYQLADKTVARKSHFYHEGKPSEYEQPRILYKKVMNATQRQHLHSNTARLLKLVEYPEIQVKYLVQLLRIAPEYARGVFDLLPVENRKFRFADVEGRAGGAEVMGKEGKFVPSVESDKLVGLSPGMAIYGAA
ncbi:catalase-like domain-containing protein [Aspergillus californicus]